MKLPQTVPRLSWTTLGVPAGPETSPAMPYAPLPGLRGWVATLSGPSEGAVNDDDLAPQPISVDFNFTSPETMSGSVGGSTSGDTAPDPLFGIDGFFQGGILSWGSPLQLVFGALGDGLLEVSLSDTEFNEGTFWGLGNHGAKVQAEIKLVKEASEVPEPSTLALLGIGLFGMGMRARLCSA